MLMKISWHHIKRAIETVRVYPVVMASAVAFTLVTLIRIYMDWPMQEGYNFLFNCLHMAFGIGALSGLAVLSGTYAMGRSSYSFARNNGLVGLFTLGIFIVLYYFSGIPAEKGNDALQYLSKIAEQRVAIIMIVSCILFLYASSRGLFIKGIDGALFMIQKSFVIAVLYGLVLMAGTSMIAGAVEALLYPAMSGKVYMVLAALSGFVAFSIFVGYFPDFRPEVMDKRCEVVQEKPRFISILFDGVIVSVMMLMILVLMLWTLKILLTSDWPEFYELVNIISSYVVIGLWLYFMVVASEGILPRLYKKLYTFGSLFICIFGFMGWWQEVSQKALKEDTYYFLLLLIVGFLSVLMLILKGEKSHSVIILFITGVFLVTILPGVGYHALPVRYQVNRLERLLTQEGILIEGRLVAAEKEIDKKVRASITDGITYLGQQENPKTPSWYDASLLDRKVFQSSFGFEWTSPSASENDFDRPYGIYLQLPSESLDISDYKVALDLSNAGRFNDASRERVPVILSDTSYEIDWSLGPEFGIPTLKLYEENSLILEESLGNYLRALSEKFNPDLKLQQNPSLEDMTYRIETNELKIMLVFNYITINLDPEEDRFEYYIEVDKMYLGEQ